MNEISINTDQLEAIFTSLGICFTRYTADREVGSFLTRSVIGVVHPADAEAVKKILQLCRQYRIPLYPVSQGKNWGLGSTKPVEHNCLLVDMRRMNRIIQLDLIKGFAVIEPGVTQLQLSQAVADSPFMLNVTGAHGDTSIVGNALERGVGYLRQRVDDIAGLEVLLGNETVIKTGSYWFTGNPQFHYPSGIGPDLRQVFVQSNFGIVLSAAISFIPRPAVQRTVVVEIKRHDLLTSLAKLKRLSNNQFFNCVVKLKEEGDRFVCAALLSGMDQVVRLKEGIMKEAFSNVLSFHSIDSNSDCSPEHRVYHDAFCGVPFSRTGAVSPANMVADFDSASPIAFRLVLPVLPFDPLTIVETLQFLDSLKSSEVWIEKTVNIISAHTIDLVLYLSFMRYEGGNEAAEMTQQVILEFLAGKGFFPYRTDIDHMNVIDYGDAYAAILQQMKSTFDPGKIIAPGRYIV